MELRTRFGSRTLLVLATAAQILAAAFGVLVLTAAAPATAVTSVPYLVNFQGRLTDNSGNVLSDGSYNIKFRIFDDPTVGTNRWEGDRVRGSSDHRITVQNGLFNIQFGDTSQGDPALSPGLFNTQTYASLYLEVELPTPATATCSTNGCASFTEGAMTPRQPLAAAPYAFNSDTLDGLDSSAFGQIGATNTFTAANLFAPTAASTVALTVKATTAGSTNSLEVFDSGGTRRAYFDASGNLNLTGVTVGSFASATSTPVCSNAGALATCNSNPSGVTLQQAYAAGNTISTTASDIALTLNSSQGFTATTVAGGTGFTTFSLADGSNATPPAQLVLVKNNDTNQAVAAGISVQSAGGGITTALDASGANITNALSIGANKILGTTAVVDFTNYDLSSLGDQTSAFTQLDGTGTASPTGNTSTSMTLSGGSPTTTLWDVGNYVKVASTNCGGTGVNTCYAKVTAKTATVLTITPAISWANNTSVTEWHLPEIGGVDTSQALANRYGRGYFIAGVATGNGTTYYSEDGISSSLASFNILDTATTINIGGASTTIALPGSLTVAGQSVVNSSGQVNGAQLQSATVANSALANSSLTVGTTGNLSGGGSVSLGGSLTLNTVSNPTFSTSVTTPSLNSSSTILLQPTSDSSTALQVMTSTGAGSRGVLVVGTSNTQVSADADLIVKSSVSVPTLTSVAFTSNSAGSLSGASGSYFYRISAIVGSETAASGEQWINSSAFTPLSPPSAPSAASGASGGISGTFSYKYTYLTANGETTPSTATSVGPVSNKKITVTIANGPAGTTGKKIYRTITGPGTSWLLVTTIANNTTTSYTDSTADGSLGVAAPSANTATTDLNSVTLTFPAFPSATGYRFYRGNSTLGEDHYQTAGSCSGTCTFTDTGSAGTAGTPTDPTAGRVGIGTSSPGYALDVTGNISASNAFISSGSVGQTQTCGSGSTYSGLTVTGGIVTAVGACASVGGGGGSGSATLQSAYDNSTVPQIDLSAGGGALTVRDTSGGLGTDLLDVQDNTGGTTYLGVSASGVSTSGSLTVGTAVNGTGALTVSSGGATTLGIDTGGAAALTLGGTNANAVNIANQSTNAASVNIANNATAHTVNIANGAASNTTTIGSTTGGTSTLQAGASEVQVTTSGALVKTSTNSGTAFQVQNAVGQTVLLADTTSTMTNGNTINYLNYSSFEAGTPGSLPTGWTNIGTANTIMNNSKQHTFNGLFSAQTTFPATSGNGLQTNSFVSAPASGTYLMSFYAKLTSGTTMTADKFVVTSTDGASHTCSPSSTTSLASSANGFQRVFCQFTATGAITNLSITVADTQARVIYIDAVQLQSNQFNGVSITIPTPFDYGAVQIRGVITNPLALINNGDSTSAFQIQNAAGTSNLFVADTLNGRIGIGTAAPTQALDVNGTVNATNFTGVWGGSAIATNEGGTGQTTYAIGDLLYASGTSALGKLSETSTAGLCLVSGQTGVSAPSWGACSSAAGAATSLNNLVTTSINQNLLPDSNSGRDIGSSALVWGHVYTPQLDAGTTGGSTTLAVGGTNATSITVGNTTAATSTNIQGGTTGGVNIGATGSSTAGSVTNIGSTSSGTGTQAVSIGSSANAANTLTLEGATISVGNGSAAHTINIGTGAAAQTVTLGSTNSSSATLIQGGSGDITLNSGNGNSIVIGSATSDTNQTLLQLDSFSTFADTATCGTTTNQGALYYNSNASSNAVRACVGGAWEDLVSTSGAGLLMFGVVPDSSNAGSVGDLAGVAGYPNSPCKVYWTATAQVTVAPCIAYSGGRKIIVPSTALATTGITTANGWANVCLSGAGGAPTLLVSGSGTDGAGGTAPLPTWSANNPILCLASVQGSGNPNNQNVSHIYDTRTFTTSQKTFATFNAATLPLGAAVVQSATANQIALPGGSSVAGVRGVVVQWSGAASATTANVIIATGGPVYVKASNTSAVNSFVQTNNATTAGYTLTTTISALGYANLGVATRTIDTACASTTCQYSQFLNPMVLR